MKNGFSKFKTGKLSMHEVIYGLMIFEKITINGHTAKVSRRISYLYHINGIGTTTFRAPRLSSYRCRENKRKCIFNYYKPAVKFHDTNKGNICIRDALKFEGDE